MNTIFVYDHKLIN